MRSIIGSTLVCDTAEVANKVAWGQEDGKRYKCIALDGTYYKAHSFTGGQKSLAQRSQKINFAQFNAEKLAMKELQDKIDKIKSINQTDLGSKTKEIIDVEESFISLNRKLAKIVNY